MSALPRALVLASLVLLALFVWTGSAAAQSSWAVAERQDAQIQKLVANLQNYTETLPGGDDAPAWVLYRQLTVDSQEQQSQACLNLIVQVREEGGVPGYLLAPYLWWAGPTAEIEKRAAFVLRDGAIVERPEATLSETRERIGIARVDFGWGELREGDVIGWSVVVSREGPYPDVVVPMAETVPMVISNVTVRGNDKYAYSARWYGLESSELSIKEQEPRDGRPMVWKISANQRPAVTDRPIAPPYPEGVPHVMLVLDESWLESEQAMVRSGWVSTRGWNQAAIAMAQILDQLTENTKGLDIALSAITTGKKTAQDKARAITAHVHDKFTLLEGPDVDPFGRRELQEVFAAKEGTEMELLVLAAVMMRQADVPVTLALLRDPATGPLEEDWEHYAQMTDAVLRVEAEGETVWYAPQCANCEPGTLPARWAGAKVLVHSSDLMETVQAEGEAMRKKAMAEGTIDPASFQAEMAGKDWSHFEELPGR